MKYDSRLWTFENFACSRDGNSLRRRIHAMARHYVSGHMAKLDPNWHSVVIRFNDLYAPLDFIKRPLTDKDACRVEFDFRPKQVVLVGPKVGNRILTDEIFGMIPEPLMALMRMCDVLKPWSHTLHNPKHVIELIDGKTVIEFENCTSGVVRNVRGDEFDVVGIDEIELDERDQVHFTRERLMEDFKVDDMQGQAVDVNYFPLLGTDDTLINTVEELLERRRLAREAYEADRPRREAEEAAARAAEERAKAEAYAALPPEEKARVDALKRRLAAQAEIIHCLLPVLPEPND